MKRAFILTSLFISSVICAYQLDECERQALLDYSPSTLRRVDRGISLNMCDVMTLHEAGICDDVIMALIIDTNSRFCLTTSDIIRLKNFGLSQKLINTMIR